MVGCLILNSAAVARSGLILLIGVWLGCAAVVFAGEIATPEDRLPHFSKTMDCVDSEVAHYVGKYRLPVLRELAAIANQGHGYASIRVLDGRAPVNYEVVANRLTLVVGADGYITRAFCR
ncbi:MAG: hypothetical protein QM523_04875 [Candidatus Pacebacteria bacterium]|nr:hypothetical protein [Candidatus Paceibacterota bacterium]